MKKCKHVVIARTSETTDVISLRCFKCNKGSEITSQNYRLQYEMILNQMVVNEVFKTLIKEK